MTRSMKVARALVLCGVALLLLAPAAQATFPGQNGRIAFVRDAFSADQIHLVAPDGSGQLQLTFAGRNFDPAWSPDGRRIAFTSTRDGNPEIYVMDADGANQRRITTDPASDTGPTWSPDGRRIAFERHADAAFDVYVVGADGSGSVNLTQGQGGTEPAWSPDGQRIAFVWNSNVFVMNADGTGRLMLTSNPPSTRDSFREPGDPDWSPDGAKIAYDLLFGGGPGHFFNSIQVMNADGSADTQYYFGPTEFVAGPAFSPDGTQIAFHCNGGLCVMPAEGAPTCCDPPPAVPGTTGRDWQPDWQPVVPGPQRDEYRKAAKFCKAERAFLGRAEFRRKYGGRPNAFAKCVRANRSPGRNGR